MKTKLFTLLFSGVLSCSAFAQASWFSSIELNPEKLRSYSRRSVVFSIDKEQVKKAFREKENVLQLDVPMPDGNKVIEFEASDIHASGFRVLDASNRDISSGLQMPVHYKGRRNERGNEMASLSLFSDGNFILLYSDRNGNVNVASLPEKLGGKENEYVAFKDSELKKRNPFQCGIDHDGPVPANENQVNASSPDQIQNDSTCRLTEIYWECDFDMFQKGNGFQGALNRFEAMFNGTAVLYEIETINIGVKALKIWNTPDPYSYTSSFAALDDFQNAGNAANWPGQLAHLLSTRPLNLGGVAYLNAICTDYRYGFSNIDFLFSDLPVYSWTLSTIAHELGHNFASNHTHNCGWEVEPGIFQQIDSCWNAEGGCQPTVKGRIGTIMSYCHLTGSVNLSLGFGPLPGDRIRESYANMPCVAGTIVIPNFTPANSGPYCIGDTIQLLADDLPGFSYQWSGPNGFSSNQQTPSLPDLQQGAEGAYFLKVRKRACSSREKSTNLVFNCMQVGNLPVNICAGASITIPFTSTGIFNPDNRFIAQLSNNAGQFSNPINLDTLFSAQPQAMRLTLPSNLPMGSSYKVRLISTSPAYVGKAPMRNLFINPMGTSPTPINGERCGAGQVNVSAGGGTNLLWTAGISETIPVFMGRKFTTPYIEQTTSYFVESGGTSKARAGMASPAGALLSSAEDGIRFSAQATFRIDSVSLYHDAFVGTTLCEIALLKDGTELYSRSINSVNGSTSTKIPLYWRINPGEGYQLICRNITQPIRKAAANFPMKVTNLLNMEGSVSGGSDYPYLFDWTIAKYTGCPSRKIEVKAKILNGLPPETPLIETNADTLICPFTAPHYEWLVNGQLVTDYNFPKIRGLLNSAYQVRYKIDSCWSDWSPAFVVSAITASGKPENSRMVSFFPNPSNGKLQWSANAGIREISLFSTEGKLVLTFSSEGKESIELSGIADGLYFLKWKSPNDSGTERLSIQR